MMMTLSEDDIEPRRPRTGGTRRWRGAMGLVQTFERHSCICKQNETLTNESDEDVNSWLRVSYGGRTYRHVMCDFSAPRDRLPQRLVAFPRLLAKVVNLKPVTDTTA